MALGELRPRHAEQQDRRARGEERDVLDQVEKRLLAPLDVVEHHDERPLGGSLLQRLAKGPRDVLRRVVASSRRAASGSTPRRPPRGAAGRAASDLDHRPVRDPLAVGKAAAADDRRLDRGQRLAASRDLPTPASPTTVTSSQRRSARTRSQHPARSRARAHGRRTAPHAAAPARRVCEESVGGDRLGLTLQLQRLDRFDLDRFPDERDVAPTAPHPAAQPAPAAPPRSPHRPSPAAPPYPSPPRP